MAGERGWEHNHLVDEQWGQRKGTRNRSPKIGDTSEFLHIFAALPPSILEVELLLFGGKRSFNWPCSTSRVVGCQMRCSAASFPAGASFAAPARQAPRPRPVMGGGHGWFHLTWFRRGEMRGTPGCKPLLNPWLWRLECPNSDRNGHCFNFYVQGQGEFHDRGYYFRSLVSRTGTSID